MGRRRKRRITWGILIGALCAATVALILVTGALFMNREDTEDTETTETVEAETAEVTAPASELPLEGAQGPGDLGSAPTEAERRQTSAEPPNNNLPLEGAQGPGDLGSAPTGALRPGDAGLHERRQMSAELTEEVSLLSPTPPPPQPVIVIDPGHAAKAYIGTEPLGPGASEQKQKSTGGTSGAASGLMEHELNLMIALQLRDELTARGYAVVLTRETADVQISNAERAQIANDYDADVYLRIHANGAENSAVNGAMTICTTSKNPFVPQMYAENYRLSECVLNAYCEVTGTKKERIWETDSMSGNNWSNVPTTMIEMGYMTNREEDLRMADPDHQRLMVQGIADGIDAYLSVSGGRVQ